MLDAMKIGEIKGLLKATHCVAKTARLAGVSRSSVHKVIDRKFKCAKMIRKVSPKVKRRRKVLSKIAKQRRKKGSRVWPAHSSAQKMANALFQETGEKVSSRQVRRDLHALGLHPYKRQVTPTRSATETLARRKFARQYVNCDWKKILFTDETWLTCNEVTGKTMWCKSRAEVLRIERKARWNVGSCLCWACVGWNFKSKLIIFPSKVVNDDDEKRTFRLDSASYIKRCLGTVCDRIKREGRILQQDNARAHVSLRVKNYLASKGVKYIDNWPPYSPDFNCIEKLWKDLQEAVGEMCPQCESELVKVASVAWRNLSQKLINRHCSNFPKALRGAL